jgi:hypothetical protein
MSGRKLSPRTNSDTLNELERISEIVEKSNSYDKKQSKERLMILNLAVDDLKRTMRITANQFERDRVIDMAERIEQARKTLLMEMDENSF